MRMFNNVMQIICRKLKIHRVSLLLGSLGLCVLPLSSMATTNSVHKNEQSGLLTWSSESEGFSVELIQLLPDFVRAIYSKYDFPADEVERIAGYCVFGTIIKNTSQQLLNYRVADWYTTDETGEKMPVKTKTHWLEEWRKLGIKFAWTLLPATGDFEIGDWQQGFTTVKLPRDTLFDFTYSWTLDKVEHSATIKNMSCAPDSL